MSLLDFGTSVVPAPKPQPKIATRIEWLCPRCKTFERGVTRYGAKKSYCVLCQRSIAKERTRAKVR